MIDRRALLRACAAAGIGALAAAGVSGCAVSDPRIVGGPTAPPPEPPVTPPPRVPGVEAARANEADLAALAARLRDAAGALRLPPPTGALAGAAAGDHTAHLTALRGPRPAERPTSEPTPGRGFTPAPAPSPTAQLPPGDGTAAVRGVVDRLAGAAEAYRATALAAQGSTALLFASLAAYASGLAYALPTGIDRPSPAPATDRPLDPWSDTEAAQQAVRQLHALVFGYQAAYPAFRGPEAKVVFDLLYRRREERDRLTAWLRERSQTVPAAEAAYALPGQPADRSRAVQLLAQMETAYQPFAGAWVAAATDPGSRRAALEALEEAVRLGLQWGGPLARWPGWPG